MKQNLRRSRTKRPLKEAISNETRGLRPAFCFGSKVSNETKVTNSDRTCRNMVIAKLLDSLYESNMALKKSKARDLTDLLGGVSTEEWDEQLRDLASRYEQVFALRQAAAKREGITAPPPAPPKLEGEYAYRSASTSPNTGLVTFNDLFERYLTDAGSPLHGLRPATKSNYVSTTQRLRTSCGTLRLADVKIDDLYRLYDGWSASSVAGGNSMMSTIRLEITYGAAVLKDENCERLSGALRNFKFKTPPKSDSAPLTFDQAVSIRKKAREKGFWSVALIQAFQFDCGLKGKDLHGEWVAEHENGESYITDEGKKWLHGIRFEEIDNNFTLSHVLSQQQKLVKIDLRGAAMVIEELEIKFPGFLSDRSLLPARGPVIVSEKTNLPWNEVAYRRLWRKIADEIGISIKVRKLGPRRKNNAQPEIERTAETEVPAVRH